MCVCATVLQAVKVPLTNLPLKTCECHTLHTLKADVCVAVAEVSVLQLTMCLEHTQNDQCLKCSETLKKTTNVQSTVKLLKKRPMFKVQWNFLKTFFLKDTRSKYSGTLTGSSLVKMQLFQQAEENT